MAIRYFDGLLRTKNVDENTMFIHKLFTDEKFYIIVRSPKYFKISSLEEIENRIANLSLPEDPDDLMANAKLDSSMIKLQLLIMRYAQLLVENSLLDYSQLAEEVEAGWDRGQLLIQIHDLNKIQRKLYNLVEEVTDELPKGADQFYKGYTKELDTFSSLVKADFKLLKFLRKQIKK